MSTLLLAPYLPTCSLYHQLDPVLDHRIHHHIEDDGVQRFSLCHPPENLENLPVVSSRYRNHLQPTPLRLEDAERSRPHAAALQYFQVYVPVQLAIRLVQVQKYHVQDLLTHER